MFRNRLTLGLDNTTTQAQLLFLPNEIAAAQDPDAALGANLRRTPTARIVTLDYSGSLAWSPRKPLSTTTSFGSQVVGDRRETLAATGIGWTKYEGTDPEVNSYGGRNFVRIDAYAAPMLRRLSTSVNLTF